MLKAPRFLLQYSHIAELWKDHWHLVVQNNPKPVI